MRTRQLAALLLAAACGGTPPTTDPNAKAFELKVPAKLQLAPGATSWLDVGIEKKNGFDGEVTVKAGPLAGISAAQQGLRLSLKVPSATPPGFQTLHLTATSAELERTADVELEVVKPLNPVTQAVDVTVTLDALFYENGQTAKVTVDFGPMTPPATLPDLVLVSSESHDVEALKLTRAAGNTFVSAPIAITASSAPGVVTDGSFTLPAGGLFFAMFAIDHTWPGFESYEATSISDFAWLDGDRADAPKSRVEPKLALTNDEKTPVPGARAVGTLMHVGAGPGKGQPVQVATEELILLHKDDAGLQAFIAASGGELISTQDVEGDAPFASLVKVDPSKLSPARLALMRALMQDDSELLASNSSAVGIYALAMAFRLEGFIVSVNPRLQYQSPPTLADPERTNLSSNMTLRGDPRLTASCMPGDMGARRCATDVPALWAYLELLDLDTQRIKVAALDMGFAPNSDFRTNADGSIDQCDFTGRTMRCGPGMALGPPTVGNSLVGSRSWHGTGVVTTFGGIVGDGQLAAGTGGQVAVPMLYKYDLAAYAFDMGAGITQAVRNGAGVINISAGYPCTAVLQVGPDFDYCSIEGRVGICAVVSAAAHLAALVFCTSPAAGIPIVGQVVCGGLSIAAAAVTGACMSTLALGNMRAPMQNGVNYAVSRGVPVVVSAGNRLDPMSLPAELRDIVDLSEARTEAWGMIPATLPNVIAVGAAGDDLTNVHFFGDAVDLWAPITSTYFSPTSVDDPASMLVSHSFGGTSAASPYVAGVIAAMQAVNPSLDPVRASASERATAVSRITSMLTSTALTNAQLVTLGFAADAVERRNLIDPYRAVLEAARGAQPDLSTLGYDTTVGFSEADGDDDFALRARTLTFGTAQNGSVLSFTGAQDQDWKQFTMPSMTGRVFGADVTVQYLGNESPMLQTVGSAFPHVSSVLTGVEKSSTSRVVRTSGELVQFAVTAMPGLDVPYKVTVSTPVALTPSLAITEPVLVAGQTLCSNRPTQFRAIGTYELSAYTVSSAEWLINGTLQATTNMNPLFTRPVGTDVFTVRAFGASATLTVTWVTCAASAEILTPAMNSQAYGLDGDVNGPYRNLTFSGRATDASGNVIDPSTLVFEWTTNRADLQPGAPATGTQLLGTGASLPTLRIYGYGPSPYEEHIITLTVRASPGGPVLSTDSVRVAVQSLI